MSASCWVCKTDPPIAWQQGSTMFAERLQHDYSQNCPGLSTRQLCSRGSLGGSLHRKTSPLLSDTAVRILPSKITVRTWKLRRSHTSSSTITSLAPDLLDTCHMGIFNVPSIVVCLLSYRLYTSSSAMLQQSGVAGLRPEKSTASKVMAYIHISICLSPMQLYGNITLATSAGSTLFQQQ